MIIQHNLSAINSINIGKQLMRDISKITEKLSSGYKINRAADNAANLAISEKMNARIRALKRCQNNIEEGIGLAQTADGALQEVNNMLVRVHELCVQAANGTNTEDDRDMIADEIEQIYEEMDHIFEDTEYNTIPVFRNDGINFNAKGTEYTYTESITKLPEGQYSEFGQIDGFQTKQFELAKEAIGASVTLTLDSDVDLNDASTLDGKSFYMDFKYEENGTIRSEKVKFVCQENLSGSGFTGDGIEIMYVDKINSNYTVQQVFEQFCRDVSLFHPFIELESATVSNIGGKNQVTFQLNPHNLEQSFQIDGSQKNYSAPDGNGIIGNEFKIYSSEGKDLNAIDSSNNTIQYGTDIYGEWYITSNDTISAEQKEALLDSYLDFNINNTISRVSFTKAEVDTLNTKADLMTLLKDKLELMDQRNVVDIDGSYLKISTKNCVAATKADSFAYVTETKKPNTEKDSNVISVLTYESISPTTEQAGEWVIELPADLDETDMPFSLNIDGRLYTFFDRNKAWIEVSSGYGWSVNDGDIGTTVKNAINHLYQNATVTLNGNKIYIKADKVNENLNVSVNSESVQYHTYGISYSESSFKQEYNIQFDLKEALGGAFDIKNLYNRGFEHNDKIYEFSNSTNELSSEETIRIDISNCSTYDEIATVMENVLNDNNEYLSHYRYEVTNTSGIININAEKKLERASNYLYKPYFIDGVSGQDGFFNDTPGIIEKSFSGGTNATQPYTVIDFSKYTSENMDELYGKGFRITCATCPGEFINIMFCEDKSTCEYPESFTYTDTKGNKNIIKNYIVELKEVSDGSQIVNNIVKQLENELDHYTEVAAQGKSLIVKDKRAGNIKNLDGVLQRAEVISGILTNYEYQLEKVAGVGLPEKEFVGDGRKDTDAYYSFVMIYASDTADNPFIPLHLPYLTLDNLKLELISDNFKTQEGVNEVMKQAKNVAEIISMARSKIGADQNRLEHAFTSATNAEIQITDAYSRIRDTDMAEAMVIQAKVSILSNVQQAMLSQIMNQPERIVSLLQA